MTPYLVLLALMLLPYLLGVHLLVVPGLFLFRRKGGKGELGTFFLFGAYSVPLSTLYTWGMFGEISQVALVVVATLSLYTGLIAATWLFFLQRRANRKDKPLNKSLNADAGKAGAG